MIDFRSALNRNRRAWRHWAGFLVWYALLLTSAGLIIYGTLAASAGARDRAGLVAAAGMGSVLAGVALLNAVTRGFPLPTRVMFVAIWLAMALPLAFL
jgi:hypothetical protein